MFFGKIYIHILVVLALFAFLHTAVHSAGDDFFTEQSFDVPGLILGCQTADFDGDGRRDIALLTSESSTARILQIYLQRDSDRFPPSVSQRFELPPTVNMFQVADLDKDGRAEVFVLDYDGLRQYKHDGTKFVTHPKNSAPGPTLFAGAIEGGIIPDEFIFEIAEIPTLFMPVAEGFLLWQYVDDKFILFGKLTFSHVVCQGERSIKQFGNYASVFAMKLPHIEIGKRNQKMVIYLLWPDRMMIFTGDDKGGFEGDVNFLRFQRESPGNLCQSKLVDYDLDNRLDLVCSQSRGGISGAMTEINFYGSDRLRDSTAVATHTVNLTDACGNLLIDNFDRTGGLELVIPAVELGTMSTVKMMITKKTDLHLLIYPIDNLGRPAKEPSVRRKMPCRLDFDKANPVNDIRVNWSGDFDGDGLPDLVMADGGGQLMFYRGSAEDYLESKANHVLDLLNPDVMTVDDLNADGRSDLIVIHKPDETSTRLTLLITNRIM